MSDDTKPQEGETKTDTEALAASQAEVEKLKSENSSLRTESAKYRTQRNDALKQAHALGAVVKAHNINFDLAKADLESLKVENGRIEGEFAYTPAENPKSDPPKPSDKSEMSMADVKNMSPDQINENWDLVQGAMKKGYD